MLVTQLIDLESLRTFDDAESCHLHDDRLDALASDLAELICPTVWRVWSDTDSNVAQEHGCPSAFGRYELPDGYSLSTEGRLVGDLEQLMADLQFAVRRAKRDRWLSQVVALPA